MIIFVLVSLFFIIVDSAFAPSLNRMPISNKHDLMLAGSFGCNGQFCSSKKNFSNNRFVSLSKPKSKNSFEIIDEDVFYQDLQDEDEIDELFENPLNVASMEQLKSEWPKYIKKPLNHIRNRAQSRNVDSGETLSKRDQRKIRKTYSVDGKKVYLFGESKSNPHYPAIADPTKNIKARFLHYGPAYSEDSDKCYWAYTPKGLDCLTKDELKFKLYFVDSSIQVGYVEGEHRDKSTVQCEQIVRNRVDKKMYCLQKGQTLKDAGIHQNLKLRKNSLEYQNFLSKVEQLIRSNDLHHPYDRKAYYNFIQNATNENKKNVS